ncbi:MAG: PIN domain-containing protein [Verrucomicrobia bacterium]|nr:PIN domain-containing protein [Verrucomicrobiota bacterium]
MPDINVWLALSFSGHPHHQAALHWFDKVPEEAAAFCRMTQHGFLRLASNPKVFRSDALPLPKAWKAFDLLISDERVCFCDEVADIESEWRRHTRKAGFSPKIWNDAYLVAFAAKAGIQLVTFDRGFESYSGVDVKILRSVELGR